MHLATCGNPRCGLEFEARRSTARYCSPACRAAAYREWDRLDFDDVRLCGARGCENELSAFEYMGKEYCSNACRQRAYRDRQKWRREAANRPPVPPDPMFANLYRLLDLEAGRGAAAEV